MTTSIQVWRILLHTGRNLKKQGLPQDRRQFLLFTIWKQLHSYPISKIQREVEQLPFSLR